MHISSDIISRAIGTTVLVAGAGFLSILTVIAGRPSPSDDICPSPTRLFGLIAGIDLIWGVLVLTSLDAAEGRRPTAELQIHVMYSPRRNRRRGRGVSTPRWRSVLIDHHSTLQRACRMDRSSSSHICSVTFSPSKYRNPCDRRDVRRPGGYFRGFAERPLGPPSAGPEHRACRRPSGGRDSPPRRRSAPSLELPEAKACGSWQLWTGPSLIASPS